MGRKVSLIMPCYNAEPNLDMMLGSVYGQLHDEIELICIDDGSTDNTRKKLEAWKPAFEQKGYEMIVIGKENGGAASAINEGLKVFTGEYVCFPDADDMLMPGYVLEMLACLESHPNEDWVRCNHIYNVMDPPQVLYGSKIEAEGEYESNQHLPERYLTYSTTPVVWVYMMRSSFLRSCLPDLHLEDSWSVQEYQLLLPLALNKPFYYLDKYLYIYMARNTGFGQMYMNAEYNKAISYWENQSNIAKKVLAKLDLPSDLVLKLERLDEVSLNKKRLYHADICNEGEIKQICVKNQLALVSQILKLSNEKYDDIPLYILQLLSDIAIDALIYSPEELSALKKRSKHQLLDTANNKNIYMYGAGYEGRVLLPALLYANIKPAAIWDKNADKYTEGIHGIPVLPPIFDNFTDDAKKETLVVVSIRNPIYLQEVAKTLADNGFDTIVTLDEVSGLFQSFLLAGL